MNELLDEDLIKKNIAKLWWKEKWRLYNAILIPIGLVLLFFEYHHYIDISSRDFGVYYDKGIIIKYSVSFAVIVFLIGNFIYYKTGKSINSIYYNKNIKKLKRQFLWTLFCGFLVEVFFFIIGFFMVSFFELAYFA